MWSRLSVGEDPSNLAPELNLFRLRRLDRVSVRLGSLYPPAPDALALALGIAGKLGIEVDISAHPGAGTAPKGATVEDDASYVNRLPRLGMTRVRLCGAGGGTRLALLDMGFEVDTTDLSPSGCHEVLHWTREQVISATLHRHGNITTRRDQFTGPKG